MNCPNCGNKIENTQKFCPNCGTSILNNDNKEGTKRGIIMLIAILFIATIVGIGIFLQNREKETPNNSKVEESNTSVSINTNTNSGGNTNTNQLTNSNSASNKNTNSNKTPEKLTCTDSLQDQYGTYYVTHNYTFKNNQLATYKMVVTAKLNKQSLKYRDSLIATYDKVYAQYKSVSGIHVSANKKKDGFDYMVEIPDSKKVDKAKLKSMNLYLINYSGIKMEAYKKGIVCK